VARHHASSSAGANDRLLRGTMLITLGLALTSTLILQPWVARPASRPVHAGSRISVVAAAADTEDVVGTWLSKVEESLEGNQFVKITLSGNTKSTNETAAHLLQLRRVQGRLISIKGGPRLQLTLKYEHRDAVHNVPLENVRPALRDYIGPAACRNGRLFCTDGDVELAISRRGVARLVRQKPALGERAGSDPQIVPDLAEAL
jgi:hypothetical protein